MLIAALPHIVSRDYVVKDEGTQIAHLKLSCFTESGQLEVAGRSFDIGRESLTA